MIPPTILQSESITMNTIYLHGTQPVAIDPANVETRLSLLELGSYARTNGGGSARFTDSLGIEQVLDAREIQELTATAHRQVVCGTSK
jgi:hypothetical protein